MLTQQTDIQMSPFITTHLCLLLLPAMSLLLLSCPVSWSYDSLPSPGCHLHRKSPVREKLLLCWFRLRNYTF